MKKILLIGTGGTIASELTASGLAPELTTRQLVALVSALTEICEIDCVELLNMDSTNMQPRHWLQIAQCIRQNYDGYDGFVLTHGTDTMAYTAAALSYLIQDSPKPIVITGSQKSIAPEAHSLLYFGKLRQGGLYDRQPPGHPGGSQRVHGGALCLRAGL